MFNSNFSSIVRSHHRSRVQRCGITSAALVTIGLLAAGCGGKATPTAATTQPSPMVTGSAGAGPAVSASHSPGATASGKPLTAEAGAGAGAGTKTTTRWGKVITVSGAIRVSDASLVARSTVPKIKVYSSATATTPELTIPNPLPSGGPLVFLVQERRGDRLRVLLPLRPNESQGWVRASDISLSQLDYRITVSARAHQLSLYRAGKLIMQEPVGLGEGTTPTPGGVFYLKELLRPSNPNGDYGPYAYGLSGYSNVLHQFLGGDGEIGIHGTSDPASVGKNVSHGCIRMRNDAITKLAKMLPLGVPVQMIA